MPERIRVDSPCFEDFRVGQIFDDAPAVTLTSGHAVMHEAVFGDRLRLPLEGGRGPLDLHALVYASRSPQAPERGAEVPVLDWRGVEPMA